MKEVFLGLCVLSACIGLLVFIIREVATCPLVEDMEPEEEELWKNLH